MNTRIVYKYVSVHRIENRNKECVKNTTTIANQSAENILKTQMGLQHKQKCRSRRWALTGHEIINVYLLSENRRPLTPRDTNEETC